MPIFRTLFYYSLAEIQVAPVGVKYKPGVVVSCETSRIKTCILSIGMAVKPFSVIENTGVRKEGGVTLSKITLLVASIPIPTHFIENGEYIIFK